MLAVALEQVGPFVGPVFVVVFAGQQLIDQFLALLSARSFIGEKRPHALGRRRQPGQIERNPANELRVGAKFRWHDFHLLQLRINEFINVVVFGHVLPFVTGPIAHHRDELRCVAAFITHEHGRLAPAQTGDDAVFDFGNVAVVAAENRVARNLTHVAVRIMRQHEQVLRATGQIQFDFGREDFNRLRAVLQRVFKFRSLDDPLAENVVFAGTGLERLPAFVRHFGGGFEQHQALLHLHPVEPAARKIIDQRLIIVFRVVTAEREFKTVLAFG